MNRLDNLTLLARIGPVILPPAQLRVLNPETHTANILPTTTTSAAGYISIAHLQVPNTRLRCIRLLAICPPDNFIATSCDPLFTAGGNIPINMVLVSSGGRDTQTGAVGAKRVLVGATGATGLFEGTELEDAGEEGPEVWDVGDDDRGRRFACVPVQVDQGAVWSGEICNSIEDGAEDLLCVRSRILSEVEDGAEVTKRTGDEGKGDKRPWPKKG